jgi:hypothetical protein
MGQVEWLIQSGAGADEWTGDVYNDTWGYGKLRILSSLRVATAVREMAEGERPPQIYIDQNYPNPFNPSTFIPFYLPQDGQTTIRIYDVKGRLVRVVRDQWYSRGAHAVHWDGTDGDGRSAASGVYFCVLNQGSERYARKMTLIR